MSMTTQEFLTALWGNSPPGKVLIWTLPKKLSIWYDCFDTIDQDMQTHEHVDVYTGVGLAPGGGVRLTRKNRLKEWQVAGIPGLWADIDVAHPVHAKSERLPPTRKQAIDAVNQLPFDPTILVNSGHGLQAWWLFEEVWLFSCPEERESARRTTQWWHRALQAIFGAHGWTLDSTFDLARVMRLPGTWNNKEMDSRKPVEVVGSTEQRYGRESFLDLVPEDFEATKMGTKKGTKKGRRGTASGGSLVLDPNAEPSFLMMETLLGLDPHFRRTWEHNRPDLPDQSPSGYDMALASRAVRVEWPDQQVVNLLIAFRRRHGLPPKLRLDYYESTLEKAKRPIERERIVTQVLDQAASAESDGDGNSADGAGEEHGDRRSQILEALSTLFSKFVVLNLERFSGRTTTYVMTTDRGRVYLPRTKDILSQPLFMERVAAGTRQVLTLKVGKGRWVDVAQLILDACVDRDMGELAGPEIEFAAWVEMYLFERGLVEDKNEAAAERLPLLRHSRVHIHLYDLGRWLQTQLGIVIDRDDLVRQLIEAGWESDRVNVTVGGWRTTYRCWRCGEDYETGDE